MKVFRQFTNKDRELEIRHYVFLSKKICVMAFCNFFAKKKVSLILDSRLRGNNKGCGDDKGWRNCKQTGSLRLNLPRRKAPQGVTSYKNL
jgi:hypothetical protein